jgi:hypothetical protein
MATTAENREDLIFPFLIADRAIQTTGLAPFATTDSLTPPVA